jgi:hypothetical protein
MIDQLTEKIKTYDLVTNTTSDKQNTEELELKYNKCLEEKRLIENTYINDQTEAHMTINKYKEHLNELTKNNQILSSGNLKLSNKLQSIQQLLNESY